MPVTLPVLDVNPSPPDRIDQRGPRIVTPVVSLELTAGVG